MDTRGLDLRARMLVVVLLLVGGRPTAVLAQEDDGLDSLEAQCLGGEVDSCVAFIQGLPPAADGQSWGDNNGRGRVALEKLVELGRPEFALVLGVMLADGIGGTVEPERARKLFREACDYGDSGGCVLLGIFLAEGRGGPQDDGGAAPLLPAGCEAGDPRACRALARLCREGKVVPRDPGHAAELSAKVCETHDGAGFHGDCYLAADALRRGSEATQDGARARRLFGRGCALDDDRCCAALGDMLAAGEGGEADIKAALSAWTTACTSGMAQPEACSKAAVRLEQGEGVPRDMEAAAQLFAAGCQSQGVSSCVAFLRMKEKGLAAEVKLDAHALLKAWCETPESSARQEACAALAAGASGTGQVSEPAPVPAPLPAVPAKKKRPQ